MFNPSLQQQDIFDAIERADENIIVDAKAGSGKTTTIVEGTKRIPRGTALLSPSIAFLAFNKNIADALKEKLPRGVQSSTFHSLGRRALANSGLVDPKLTRSNDWVNGRKCAKWVYNAMDRNDPDVLNVIRLVGLCKSVWPCVADNLPAIMSLVKHFELPFENIPRALNVANSVFKKSNECLDMIDFDDMLFLPVFYNCPFDPQDWIFVDEAQDTNDIQLEILERLQKPRQHDELIITRCGLDHPDYPGEDLVAPTFSSPTRLCAVGDPHQAIYGFRGANSDSMSRIAQRFSCKTYPLSVSYRCSKAVVKEAQRYLV